MHIFMDIPYIEYLVQDCSISSALTGDTDNAILH